MVLVYRKSLRLSFLRGGVGDIVNLISNECNRVAEACVTAHYFWAAFVETVGKTLIRFLSMLYIVYFSLSYMYT